MVIVKHFPVNMGFIASPVNLILTLNKHLE